MADQRLDRPAKHGLAPEQSILLRHSAAQALAFASCHDEGSDGHERGRLGPLALSAKGCSPISREPMSELKPIHVGPLRIEAPVILAPMTGVTDLPFRRIVKRYGAGLTVSEMIASQAMIRETRQSLQKSLWDPAEEPVSLQLAGCEPQVMAEAAKLNEQRGAAIIDINMGCPVKKVVNGDAGSALMRDLPLAARLIETTVKAVKVPVTLKTRMGWNHYESECAGTRTHRRRPRCADDHHSRPHPLPAVQGRSGLGFVRKVKDAVSHPSYRQWRHLFG